MTKTDQERLAKIRSDNYQWLAVSPGHASSYDTTFLLKIIDELNEKINRVAREGR